VGKDQHRWKVSVSDQARFVLEESARRLKWAWEIDKNHPKSYPLNTDKAFSVVHAKLELDSGDRSGIQQQALELPSPPIPPKRLSELLHEKTIKAVYEKQNDGSYEDALKLATSGERKGHATWRKILQAVNAAYLIPYYGDEFIPRPQVHFLHRNLLDIADVVRISDLTHQGIAEFLDDLCPCGRRHEPETIRKLRMRWKRGKQVER
jgi:hypothetical protein